MSKPIDLPAKLWPLTKPKRYNILHGGRGSGKSESVARLLIIKAMQTQRRILCCREFQASIRESVHALLKSVIHTYDLLDKFTINFNSIKCNVTGSEFVFAGLAEFSVDSIKSLYGFTDVWVEEAQRLSKRSMDMLLPTIRAEGSVFYFTFNPELETDPVYKRFVSEPDPRDESIVIEMNYPDNPWFPEVLRVEMEACKRRSHEDYLHIWMGKTRSFTQASILGHLIKVQEFEPDSDWQAYYGIDWGFAADPTVLVKCFVHNRTLFIRNESHTFHTEINDYSKCFLTVPGAIHGELWADNSRPESISYLNNPNNYLDRKPLNVKAAPKWSGSVEDGIAWLRSLDAIVVHPDCPSTAYELARYSWKVDKLTGAILPVPASGFDHCLTGDTLIQTPNGLRSMRELAEQGSGEICSFDEDTNSVVVKKFYNARMTGIKKTLCVTLSTGYKFTCSENHIVRSEMGWIFAKSLRVGDKLPLTELSLLMDLRSSKIPKPVIGCVQKFDKDCIAIFGRNITGQLKKVFTFTTKTTTKTTTRLKTSNCSKALNTCVTICRNLNAKTVLDKASKKQELLLFFGTKVMRGVRGILNTVAKLWQNDKRNLARANIAASNMKVISQKISVRMLANRHGGEHRELITFQGNVAVVEQCSPSTNTLTQQHAVEVVDVCRLEHEHVYNLEVEDTHNYIDEHGIIHHNCADAIRYALNRFIKRKLNSFDIL